jgi:hypothetical protein
VIPCQSCCWRLVSFAFAFCCIVAARHSKVLKWFGLYQFIALEYSEAVVAHFFKFNLKILLALLSGFMLST